MQLQKLVYFAHGWNLALTDKPLINEAVKAWNFGPVIPPLYNALQKYKNGVVREKINPSDDPPLDLDTQALLGRIWDVYGKYDGIELSEMTHQQGSAWDRTYRKEKFSAIDNSLIAEEFKKIQ